MALGTATLNLEAGARPSAPVYHLDLSFTGEASYPTNGSPGFAAYVQAAAKAATPPSNVQVTAANIVGIEPFDCGGYFPVYDKTNDKLKVYWCAGSGAAAVEVTATTNLSGVTFRMTVSFQ